MASDIHIKEKAHEVLESLGYNEPPFDPFQIAKDLGFTISKKITLGKLRISGTINKDKIIWINPFDSKNRQRYTAAHLLGHYFNGDLEYQDIIIDTPETIYR